MEGSGSKSKSPFLMDGAVPTSTTSCRCGGDVLMEVTPSYSPKCNQALKLLSQLESLIDDFIKNKGSNCVKKHYLHDFNDYFIKSIKLISEINKLVINYEISDNNFKERFEYCIRNKPNFDPIKYAQSFGYGYNSNPNNYVDNNYVDDSYNDNHNDYSNDYYQDDYYQDEYEEKECKYCASCNCQGYCAGARKAELWPERHKL